MAESRSAVKKSSATQIQRDLDVLVTLKLQDRAMTTEITTSPGDMSSSANIPLPRVPFPSDALQREHNAMRFPERLEFGHGVEGHQEDSREIQFSIRGTAGQSSLMSTSNAGEPSDVRQRNVAGEKAAKEGRRVIEVSDNNVWLALWQKYVNANKTHPLRTKCLTTGVLMATGNCGAQAIMMMKGKQKGFIYRKLLAFVFFGTFLSGPMGHAWLKFLNGHKVRIKGQLLILYKIILDRFLYGPMFNAIMMSFVYKISGQSWKGVFESLKKTFWAAQVLNWKIWPIAQYINFNFIPPELQVLDPYTLPADELGSSWTRMGENYYEMRT
ncbi:hypothetical protein GUITHDRAFT_132665 [Guillardia theta CCMP2712]|uniref:Uncharacterized protein n=1 Tax=Guillardia theta (strain CCMP2712) TaxID=905079 RepID=L1JYX7_GUITC|nr:hypothetical protein GUITHDRAFT_132665 [Guillardia theta CCMP2712]EKX53549.1 hypothetical protein GUITHDRAFT_132665 [Guillardia theta CCMP2712]|eukprot:XP_005840529.1 hypothetical protein GUITHDRAFT_132665 [Guillardia theta CCMP2712]